MTALEDAPKSNTTLVNSYSPFINKSFVRVAVLVVFNQHQTRMDKTVNIELMIRWVPYATGASFKRQLVQSIILTGAKYVEESKSIESLSEYF